MPRQAYRGWLPRHPCLRVKRTGQWEGASLLHCPGRWARRRDASPHAAKSVVQTTERSAEIVGIASVPKTSTEHDIARRVQIVAAAARCFARSGFAATTIPDIVRDAGLSTGSIYHYFNSKEQLFLAVVTEYVAVYDEAFFTELQRQGPPLARLEAALLHLQEELAAQSPTRARIALELWSRAHDAPDLHAWLAEARERRIAAVVGLLSELCAAGELSSAEVADGAARLMALADGLVVQRACADFAALPGMPLAAGLRGLLGSRTS